jgi:hypothetical protein
MPVYYFYRPWRIRVGVRLARPNVLWWGEGGGWVNHLENILFTIHLYVQELPLPQTFSSRFSIYVNSHLSPISLLFLSYESLFPPVLFISKDKVSRDCQEKLFFMSLFLFPVSNP